VESLTVPVIAPSVVPVCAMPGTANDTARVIAMAIGAMGDR
jgi:hypothetical protein